jgi:ribosomal protein S12 methylthiotransferase
MAEYKHQGCEALVVTGCLSQRHPDELATEIPEIDHILGSADFSRIAAVLDGTLERARAPHTRTSLPVLPVIEVAEVPRDLYDHHAPRILTGAHHSAYVKIAEGCDRPCAFCIIPTLRGPQRSRDIDSVVSEVTNLVASGVREVNLVAQDLTRYGADLPEKPTLAMLLRRVARVPGLRWVRLHYTYPSAFTDELIDVIADEPTVAKYIDVPLQHIDDDMLKRMRRGHSARVTYELIETLRRRIEGLVLRTTFIVGHPGETEEAFQRLVDFVRASRFERVGVFTYSSEPGTVSALLPQRVAPELAEQRRDALMAVQAEISHAYNQSLIGSEIEVLVEGLSDESDLLLQGRWYGQAPEIDGTVYLADGTAQPGDFVRARVTDCADYDLAATILDDDIETDMETDIDEAGVHGIGQQRADRVAVAERP